MKESKCWGFQNGWSGIKSSVLSTSKGVIVTKNRTSASQTYNRWLVLFVETFFSPSRAISLSRNGAPQSRNSIASHLPSGTVHGSDTALGNTSGRGDQSGCGKRKMDSHGILRELSWMSIFPMIILCEFTLGKLINEDRLKHQEITTSCLLQEEHVY